MKLNLRQKIILTASGVLLVTLGINTAVSSVMFSREYKDALQGKTLVIARSLKSQLDRLLFLGISLDELVGFEEQCKEIVSGNKDISAAFVIDATGKILFHSSPGMTGKKVPKPEIVSLINQGEENISFHRADEVDSSEDHYDIVIPVIDSNNLPVGAVIVQFPEEVISQKTTAVLSYILIISVAAFILAAVLLLIALVSWFTKPLGELLAVIREIRTGGDLSKTVKIKSSDEIGQLGQEFNAMAVKLKESYGALEERVKERTKEVEKAKEKVEVVNQELSQKVEELEQMNKLMVGRELKMTELKKEIEELKKKLGQA